MKRLNFGIANLLVIFIALLSVAAMVGLVYAPARRALDQERDAAHAVARELQRAAKERVGPEAILRLSALQSDLDQVLQGFESDLKRRGSALSAWFMGLKFNAGLRMPYADDFRRAYAFAQDELRRELGQRLAQNGAPEHPDLPLYTPAFLSERRDPRNLEEMQEAQRLFNLERLLLLRIASLQGSPTQATRFRLRAASQDPSLLEIDVDLTLHLPSERLPSTLAALRTAGQEDPFIGITRIEVQPGDSPEALPAGVVPPVLVDLGLVVRIPSSAVAR